MLEVFIIQTADQQLRFELFIVSLRKLGQPFIQPLAHFTGSFFGEGDGQNLMRLDTPFCIHAVQQRPHHAGHQHPGFARTGAGLDSHIAARVAGNGVEGFGRNAFAVVGVGRLGLGLVHVQKSFRHRPRAAQYSHALPSPSAPSSAPLAIRSMSSRIPLIRLSRSSTMPGWA